MKTLNIRAYIKIGYYFISVIIIAIAPQTNADIRLPDISQLEAMAKESGDLDDADSTPEIVYEDTDFLVPAKGKLQTADIKWMRKRMEIMGLDLANVPGGSSGTGSDLYPLLVSWRNNLNKALDTGLESDFFPLIGPLITAAERKASEDEISEDLSTATAEMLLTAECFIRALAYHIKNGTGPMEEGLFRQAVRLFGNWRLLDESAWDEDDRMPVDSAGIFILNPEVAMDELKKRPPERVRDFLCNVKEPAAFFDRYVGEGDGLERLKAKYGAEKAAIDAKFVELAAWAATLPDE